jgi:hypothetical protein
VGPCCQRNKRKEKGKLGAWAAAGRSWWAAEPLGWKGEKGKFFFFFSFSNPFQTKLFELKFK